MELLKNAIDGVSGDRTQMEDLGPASRASLIAVALLAAGACSALFGLAVGLTPTGVGLSTVIKVPVVVVLSGLFALPLGALTVRLVGSPIDVSALWMSQATGTLTASLVLAASAPLVGLFYYSSDAFGGVIAVAMSFVAIAAGLFVFARAVGNRAKLERSHAAMIPAAALIFLQGLAVLQLVAVASPILPEVTPFSQGLDGLVAR